MSSSRYTALLSSALLVATLCPAADPVPQTLEELWADFPAGDKATPLDTEILKAWEEHDVTLRLVRFTIGTFKGEKLKLAGFYAFPKGKHKRDLPALVVCHGGGQKASIERTQELGHERLCRILSQQWRPALGQKLRGSPQYGLWFLQPFDSKTRRSSREGSSRPGTEYHRRCPQSEE